MVHLTIVVPQILERIIEEEEYLAVFFTGRCREGDICMDMLEAMENIDTNLQERKLNRVYSRVKT